MNKDEKDLQNMLTKKLSASAEEKFWDRFEREAELPVKSVWGYLAGGLVAAGIAVVIFINYQRPGIDQDMVLAMQNQEMLEDLEFYADLDESMIDLPQEDWDVLLADNS